MASLSIDFRIASEKIHGEHQALIEELRELDGALDELASAPDLAATAQQVCRCGKTLFDLLPGHFTREETTVLATVARVSPELAEFAREMRRQHDRLRFRLDEFCRAVEATERGGDHAIEQLCERGKLLARELVDHVMLEEEELGGFL